LSAGDKLPSTRKLSEELRISRNVVLEAYDLLLAEGYLESRRGSGHFVAPGIRLDAPAADAAGSERAWTAIDRDSDDGVID
ncbi:winged helix-turn-helix domain-containing protein, partial [Anoxybacillus sp. LAT_38]